MADDVPPVAERIYGPSFVVSTRTLSNDPMAQVTRIVILRPWNDDEAHLPDHPDHAEYERQTLAALEGDGRG